MNFGVFSVTVGIFRRFIQFILALACLSYAGSSGSSAAPKNVLRLVASDYPPFEMARPDEGLSGFDYEVVTKSFEITGYRTHIRFMPWNRAIAEVESGKAAAVLSCAYRAQRQEFALYSDQISSSTDGVFYRKDHIAPEVTTITDLIGRSVAAVQGYATHSRLQDIGANPIGVPDDAAGLKMLEVGRFDYFFNGRQATDFRIRQLGMSGKFDFSATEDKPLFLCISKAYPEAERILADFNRGLSILKADGTYALIHAKYQ